MRARHRWLLPFAVVPYPYFLGRHLALSSPPRFVALFAPGLGQIRPLSGQKCTHAAQIRIFGYHTTRSRINQYMLKDLLFSLRSCVSTWPRGDVHPFATLGIGATSCFQRYLALLGNPYPYLGAKTMIELMSSTRKEKCARRIHRSFNWPPRQAKWLEAPPRPGEGWNLTTTARICLRTSSPHSSPEMQAPILESRHAGRTILPVRRARWPGPQPSVLLGYRFARHFNSDPGSSTHPFNCP